MRRLRRATSCGVLVHRHAPAREYLFLRLYHAWDLPKGRLEAGEDERVHRRPDPRAVLHLR